MVGYSIGTCIIINIALLCHGFQSDGIGFGYQESEEQDPAKQNALVRYLIFDFVLTFWTHNRKYSSRIEALIDWMS